MLSTRRCVRKQANTQTHERTNRQTFTNTRANAHTHTHTHTHISFALAPGLTLKTRILPHPPSTSTILHYVAPVCKSNKGHASTWRFGRLLSCRGRSICLEKLAGLPWEPDVHHPLLVLVFIPGFLVPRNLSHFCFGPRPSSPHAMCTKPQPPIALTPTNAQGLANIKSEMARLGLGKDFPMETPSKETTWKNILEG